MTTRAEQLEEIQATQQHRLDIQKQTLEHIEKIKRVTKTWDTISLFVAVFVGWMLRELIVHEPQTWAWAGTAVGCLFIIVVQVLNQRRLKEVCEMFHCVFLPEEQKE